MAFSLRRECQEDERCIYKSGCRYGAADVAIARIAEVVQANSATSQETSATSEELTAQATTLSEMVAQFKLRND